MAGIQAGRDEMLVAALRFIEGGAAAFDETALTRPLPSSSKKTLGGPAVC